MLPPLPCCRHHCQRWAAAKLLLPMHCCRRHHKRFQAAATAAIDFVFIFVIVAVIIANSATTFS
jgi:hypothetical protein